jgi:hypothetical protein
MALQVAQIVLRRGTAAEWDAANPVLAEGEQGYEKDTRRLKIGDGATSWRSLPYFIPGGVFGGVIREATNGSVPARSTSTPDQTRTVIFYTKKVPGDFVYGIDIWINKGTEPVAPPPGGGGTTPGIFAATFGGTF